MVFHERVSKPTHLRKNSRVHERKIDHVIYLRVPEDVLMRRIAGRQTCKTCGSTYNIYYFPSKRPDVCDHCGGRLYQRNDDNLETARHRLEVYFSQTMPLIQYYNEQGSLVEVDGQREMSMVTDVMLDSDWNGCKWR